MTNFPELLRKNLQPTRELILDAADALEKMVADNAAMELQIAELRRLSCIAVEKLRLEPNCSHIYADIRTALATKAPDEYLKAWLGEPIVELVEGREYDLDGNKTHLIDLDYYRSEIDALPVGTKLYAPKGLV